MGASRNYITLQELLVHDIHDDDLWNLIASWVLIWYCPD